jgi:peptide/nickel transport system substrate-binding protein
VRRALTLAIDRRELIVVLNLPAHTPLVTGPYTDRQLRLGALPEPLPYDEVWAGALLDSAGWRDANGDGVRERDGRLLRFTALVGSEPGWSPIAVYVQDRLQRVGVQMDIYALEQASLWAKLRLETFDAAFSRAPNDANVWRLWFGRESTIGYANAEVAGLLDRLPMAMDPEEEDQIRHRLALIFRDDVPATFLFPHVHYTIADSRIRGLSSPWRADPLRYMEDLWLENTAAR